MADFPSNEKLDSMCNYTTTLKWIDLPTPEWYRIDLVEEKTTRFGTKMILKLTNCEGELFSVWAPDLLSCKIKEEPKLNFVQAKGLVTSKQNPSRKYHDFSLAFFE